MIGRAFMESENPKALAQNGRSCIRHETRSKDLWTEKPADAQYVNDAGADYAGFVFYEKSRRNLSRQQAEEIMKKSVHG